MEKLGLETLEVKSPSLWSNANKEKLIKFLM